MFCRHPYFISLLHADLQLVCRVIRRDATDLFQPGKYNMIEAESHGMYLLARNE
jgi:hypothetical protein